LAAPARFSRPLAAQFSIAPQFSTPLTLCWLLSSGVCVAFLKHYHALTVAAAASEASEALNERK